MKIIFINHKLASGTHTEWILNRDKKHNKVCQNVLKNYYKDKILIRKLIPDLPQLQI